MNDLDLPPAPPARQRSWRRVFGVVVRAPVGCLAFAVGAALVFVGVVPLLVTRYGPEIIEDAFEGSFAGELEVESMDLSWTRRLDVGEIELADPDGDMVLEARFTGPSVLSMLEDEGSDLGRSKLDIAAIQLVRGEDRTWNFTRALERRDGEPGRSRIEVGEGRHGGGLLELFVDKTAEFELSMRELQIVDEVAGGPSEALTVEGFELEALIGAPEGNRIRGGGRITAPTEGQIVVEGELARGIGLAEPFPLRNLRVSVDRIAVAWIDAFLAQGGRLVEVVGPVARAELALVSVGLAPERIDLDLELEGARTTVNLRLFVREGVLRQNGDVPSTVTLRDAASLAEGYLVPLLPEGFGLAAGSDSMTLTIADLTLPLEAVLGGQPGDLLGQLGLSLDTDFGDWVVATAGGPLNLRTAALSATVRPETGVRATLTALAGDEGAIAIDLSTGPLARMATDHDLGRPLGIQVDLTAASLPTAPLDGALAANGLLESFLGSAITVKGDINPGGDGDAWDVDLSASTKVAEFDLTGLLRDGQLYSRGGQPMAMAFDLTPKSSARLVQSLIPVWASVQKPAGARRARLSFQEFALPLDGNLSGLDGVLDLDLGPIVADWLPQLGLAQLTRTDTFDLGRIRARIEGGVLTYDRFELEINGRSMPFQGGVDLSTGAASLTAAVPVQALGGELGGLVERLGGNLDGDLALPFTLSGRWPDADISIDSSELVSTALEDELGEQLGEQLGEELGGLIGDGLKDVLETEGPSRLRSIFDRLKRDG